MNSPKQGKDRLIFALDVPTGEEAVRLVDELGDLVSFYKVGLELLMSGGMENLLKHLITDKHVFVDLKLPGDIPETVRRVVESASDMGVRFLTLSASSSTGTVEAAKLGRGEKKYPELLFVSFLSSLDRRDFAELSGKPDAQFEAHLLERSRSMLAAGCDGLVASGESIRLLRKAHPTAVIVSPAIRMPGASTDDHKRFATPKEAIEMGADYLVVGRPIRNAPPGEGRRRVARAIIDDIDAGLDSIEGSKPSKPTASRHGMGIGAPVPA